MALCWPARADAQDPAALQKVTELNKKAVAAYENLEIEEASKHLRQALELCAAEGLNSHPLKARTHIHLGVVLVAGLKQRDRGVQQFKRALEVDPNVKPTKSLLNPDVQAAFDEAVKELAAGPVPKEPEPPKPPEPPKEEAPKPPVESQPAPGRPPANLKGIFHEPVTEARPGSTVTIKAAVETALSPDKVLLVYRPEGALDFLQREMEKDGEGWYVARIPEPATQGNVVSYYVEARNTTGQPLAANGSSGEPHVVSLAAAPPASATTNEGAGDEPGVAAEGAESGGAGKYWFALGLGGGAGWAKGTPELNRVNKNNKKLDFSGFAPAQLLHIAPEVGFFQSANLILSLQGRFQIVTGGTIVEDENCPGKDLQTMLGRCEPAKGAVALLAKATWLLGEPKALRPFVSLAAGGGEIRHLVSISDLTDCGPARDLVCQDTIVGGSFLIGPAAGFTYELSKSLSFVAGVNVLAGLPNPTVNFDVNVGMALGL